MTTKSQRIKSRLGHPVVDCDGHLVEVVPHYLEHLERVAGADLAHRFGAGLRAGRDWLGGQASERERRETRQIRTGWWTMPTANALDSATPLLPRLLHERLDRFGIDFTILYPGLGLMLPAIAVDEVRRAGIRALNAYLAETWGPYADRMTPAAVIPMHTPAEALDELDFAIGRLGLKAISIPPGVWRPIPALEARAPGSFPEAGWLDCYGLDSEHDYDPVWRRCQELRVAVTSHGGTVPNLPWHGRSTTSYVYNHVGTHAHQQSLLCKALFLGGVMRRFPELHFGFLECGVGWAVAQYADLIGHWEKRGAKGLESLDPAKLDRERFLSLFKQYGDRPVTGEPHEISIGLLDASDGLEARDDFAALGIERAEDFRDRFTRTLFFGCEADDPITAWAFDTKRNPFGARLNAVFSSDIGHWDVIEMERVLEEAWEAVEEGILTEADLRAFAFEHPVSLHGRANPRFFEGTAVETAAAAWLAG